MPKSRQVRPRKKRGTTPRKSQTNVKNSAGANAAALERHVKELRQYSQFVRKDADSSMSEAESVRHLGVRLNDLELTRSTEQTSILMSLLVGRGVRGYRVKSGRISLQTKKALQRKTANNKVALQSILGCLKTGYFNGSVVHRLPRDCARDVVPLWKNLHPRCGELTTSINPEHQLDLVVSPVDGIRDLLYGYDSGSISVIAGGPPESFLRTDPGDPDGRRHPEHYMLITLGSSAEGKKPILPENMVPRKQKVLPLDEVFRNLDIGTRLQEHTGKKPHELTLATMKNDQPRHLRHLLSKHGRVRTFFGSSVAAAMTPFFPSSGMDAFTGVVRRTHAILICVAALSTGGKVYAFPIAPPGEWRDGWPQIPAATLVHGTAPLVRQPNNVFLVATGVTDTLLLRSVRFLSSYHVSTSTLVLSSHSKSTRFMTHQHNLREKRFYGLDGEKSFDQLVKDYEGEDWL